MQTSKVFHQDRSGSRSTLGASLLRDRLAWSLPLSGRSFSLLAFRGEHYVYGDCRIDVDGEHSGAYRHATCLTGSRHGAEHLFQRTASHRSSQPWTINLYVRSGGIGGYIVEPADVQTLRVTYYRGSAAAAQAFFVADVREGKVVRKELFATSVALTANQVALARARDVAAERARERSYKPCTPLPFNTVVVPSRNGGPVAVYLLSAQQDAGTYPMGGNYRVIVAPDGTVLASRPYSVSCLSLTVPKLPAGAKPVGFMVNHLLDPVPTEIHVFASYSLRMPVFVATPDKRVWEVQGSKITLSSAK